MSCNCSENMQLIKTEDEYSWSEDIPSFVIYENWECTACGTMEKIDVTGSYICENPEQINLTFNP